jgi:hypothetical protein
MLPSLMLAISAHGAGKITLAPLPPRNTLIGIPLPPIDHNRGQLGIKIPLAWQRR